tara:strand:- start:38 stop:415 length:378 start_codon:yes stop_codon:yes gene_type:complete
MDSFNGLTYEINEISDTSAPTDLSDLKNQVLEVENTTDFSDDWSTNYLKLQLHYNDNFTVKDLHKICDFYEIDKRKKRKDEIVEDIVLYELDENNLMNVQNRKRLWFYVQELKNDKFFKKYVIWE